MRVVRIALATIFAPIFAALPYFAVGVWAFCDSGGGPPAQGALACIVLVVLAASGAVLVLAIARFAWKDRDMVARRTLFSVPLSIAALFLFLIGILPGCIFGDGAWSTFPLAFVTSVSAATFGVLSAAAWLRYSYDSDTEI
jgi:hypothetical membrane protein